MTEKPRASDERFVKALGFEQLCDLRSLIQDRVRKLVGIGPVTAEASPATWLNEDHLYARSLVY
jgi:hypothetical protein